MEIPKFILPALLSKQVQPSDLQENNWTRRTFPLGDILRAKAISIFLAKVLEYTEVSAAS